MAGPFIDVATALLVAASSVARDAPATVLERGDGYTFERPADWHVESFKGGFFLRSPRYGGAIIIGDQARAPRDRTAFEALVADMVNHLPSVTSPRVTEKEADRIAGRDAFSVHYVAEARIGGDAAGLASAVILPDDRVLSFILRAIPAERLAEWGPLYRRLLDSVRLVSPEPPAR